MNDIKNEVGDDNTKEEVTEQPPETKIEAIPMKNQQHLKIIYFISILEVI